MSKMGDFISMEELKNMLKAAREEAATYRIQAREKEEANKYLDETLGTFNDKVIIDWNKPIEFVDPALKDITIEKHHRLKNSVYLIIKGVKVASIGYNDLGIATEPFLAEKVFNTFLPDRTVNIYHIQNKHLTTQKELDEVLGKCEDRPYNKLESSLKEDLQRVHEALKDSLLRVESQAFAIFVKENKGTDIATDYYNFRKLAGRFK